MTYRGPNPTRIQAQQDMGRIVGGSHADHPGRQHVEDAAGARCGRHCGDAHIARQDAHPHRLTDRGLAPRDMEVAAGETQPRQVVAVVVLTDQRLDYRAGVVAENRLQV